MWYFRLDSNLQHAAFEAASSASWDTEALLIYINFPKIFNIILKSVGCNHEFEYNELVLETGLEPVLPYGKRILSPLRLPIPPFQVVRQLGVEPRSLESQSSILAVVLLRGYLN